MSLPDSLRELFDEHGVSYEILEHEPAFTAQEEAAAAHVPGRNWAKTVVVEIDGEAALAVLPATRRIDLERFGAMTGAKEIRLPDEEEFEELYPDSEPGAMPPFGILYGQRTFVDESLREDETIAFHAGDHRTAVRIPYSAFEELAEPIPGRFSRRAG